MTTIRERLAAIEADLDADNYRPGPWSRLIRNFGSLNDQDKLALSADITRISNKLHRRNGYPA
ncbi:MAG: hypothetical protein KDI36_12885 [Pseudomonadales bacterium]|nr:hypothetical protein [Pseudomonadales bacterium]